MNRAEILVVRQDLKLFEQVFGARLISVWRIKTTMEVCFYLQRDLVLISVNVVLLSMSSKESQKGG